MSSGTAQEIDGAYLRAQLAERGLDVELTVPAGSITALIGPNGAGKSTVLDLFAGLVRPDRGRAEAAGRTLFQLDGSTEVWLPPHRRGIGLLAQDGLLFPHLSVAGNVAFGPRCAGAGRRAAAAAADEWLARVGASELAQRRPHELSGGQAQRVALARCLAAQPSLLLLDEPLAAVDGPAAAELRALLRQVLADRTTILVTHEPLDAALIADRVAVIAGGRVVQEAPTAQVLRHPDTPFAAALLGVNLVPGTAGPGNTLVTGDGQRLTGRPGPAGAVTPGDPAYARFAPSAVTIHLAEPAGSARNVVAGNITGIEAAGGLMRVRVGRIAADVTPAAVAELGLVPGLRVILSVKAAEVSIIAG